MNRHLISFVKVAVSVTILTFLFWTARDNKDFSNVLSSPKRWEFLLAGQLFVVLGITLSFWRWYLLVRALDLPIRIFDAFRIGFIGHMFGVVSIGTFGSDAVRVFYVAKENPDQKTQALLSVFVDRVCGLMGLFLLTTFTIMGFQYFGESQFLSSQKETLKTILRIVSIATILGLSGFISLFLFPYIEKWNWVKRMTQMKWGGAMIQKTIDAGIAYKSKPLILLFSLFQSVCVHILLTLSVFCIAVGLSGTHPSLFDHCIISPIAHLGNVLPLPGGIGAVEYALNFFYQVVSPEPTSYGFIVALGYRLVTLVAAIIGVVYYLRGRREFKEIVLGQESAEDQVK